MPHVPYPKLVRDNIPEIIEKSGKIPVTDVLTEDQFSAALDLKLQEEVQEFLESHQVEEIADILEVLHAIATVQHIPWEDIEKVRQSKAQERGGFEKGIRLLEVRSSERAS